MTDYTQITDWQKWREGLNAEEIEEALQAVGPPYVEGRRIFANP